MNVVLNGILFLFGLASMFYAGYSYDIFRSKKAIHISPWGYGSIFILAFVGGLCALTYLHGVHLSFFLQALLSYLIILNLSIHGRILAKPVHVFYIICCLGVLVMWYVYPNFLIHNSAIILAIAFLGPLLRDIVKLTKGFIIKVLIGWTLYDILFVWVTSIAQHVIVNTRSSNFPLGIYYKNSSVGTGDLLCMTLALSMLPKKMRMIALSLYIISVLLLELATKIVTIKVFPLLVIWGPLSILLLSISDKKDQ